MAKKIKETIMPSLPKVGKNGKLVLVAKGSFQVSSLPPKPIVAHNMSNIVSLYYATLISPIQNLTTISSVGDTTIRASRVSLHSTCGVRDGKTDVPNHLLFKKLVN